MGVEPDRDELEDLYRRQGLTIAQVAERLGVKEWRVARALRDHGIPTRLRVLPDRGPFTRKVLQDLYVDRGLSMREIAEPFGTPLQRVAYWLRTFGILRARAVNRQRRRRVVDPPGMTKDVFEELYLRQRLRMTDII